MATSDPGGPALRIVGLMSGTSADGTDAALVTVSGSGEHTRLQLERFEVRPYSSDIRESVLDMMRGYGSAADLAMWHYRLGEIFAQAAASVLQGEAADAIASHGQTVVHLPRAQAYRATLQLGAPAVIAARTGYTVVSDFRAADLAQGGEGAPLVSFADWILLRHPTRWRVALNIGGVANLTYLPPASSHTPPIAFDTGPGNAPLDRAAYRLSGESAYYDADGALAARGQPDEEVLDRLLQHPFLALPPPKSTGREEFGEGFADQVINRELERGKDPADIAATLTRFTAASIACGVRQLAPVDEVVVSGGGRHNRTLMRLLARELPDVPLVTSDELGLNGDAKEALAFALLANQTLRGLEATLPTCTGARAGAVLGSITPGANYVDLMRKLWS